MRSHHAPKPLGAGPRAARLLPTALALAALGAAGLLSSGTSKSAGPASPDPASPGQGGATATAPGGGPGASPGNAPGPTPGTSSRDIPAASLPLGQDPCVGGQGPTQGLPTLPVQQAALPDGLFHGYIFSTPGARECGASLPSGSYVRCAVDRGKLLGCGSTVFRGTAAVVCKDEVFRSCLVAAAGHLSGCGAAYSGWTVTERRGSLRRCCVREGKVKYCTNDADYVCTTADQRRMAPRPLPPRYGGAGPGAGPSADPGYADPVPRPYSTHGTPPVRTHPRRGSFKSCSIFNGQVSFCRGWYHGQAVVFRDGAYRSCRIFNGQVSFCGSWYQGEAVVFRNGAYRSCRIFNGQVSSCSTWYRGEAAVYRED